jgi:D-arabinose 1-dehydrogenase-like Zn-dependent alcohol dehydrogenase
MWYSFGRFFIEGIRLDPSDVVLGLRTNQISALVGLLLGLALFMIQRARHTGIETTGYLPGRSNKKLAAAESASADESITSAVEESEVELAQSKEKD